MPGANNPSHDDLTELARKTRELIELIYFHPLMDNDHPERSPKMLWHSGDFLRRTWTDSIAPNLPPAMASLNPSIAFADPRCEDPRRGLPGAPPRSDKLVPAEAANDWPETDVKKYRDALMRNMMASNIILNPNDSLVPMMFPAAGEGGFDFGEEIKEKARRLS